MAVPHLLHLTLKLSPDITVSKIQTQRWKGEDLQCVVTKHNHPGWSYCFDKNKGLLRTIHQGRVLYEYADYAMAGTKDCPRTLRMWDGEQLNLEATTEELTLGITVAPEIFVAPVGAVAWVNCDDIVGPRKLHTPHPGYPTAERNARRQGVSLLYMAVGTDGHTHDIAILDSASPGFDAAAMAAVAKWEFRPATCHGMPVAYEMSTEVNFRLY